MKCPFCGQDHADEALFCPNTGKKFEIINYCMACGRRLKPNQKKCRCGVRVGDVGDEKNAGKNGPRRLACLTILIILLITFASCLVISAVVLLVDPLGLHIPGRLLGRYDAAAESMPASTDFYLGVNLLNIRPNSIEQMAPLALPLGYLFGDQLIQAGGLTINNTNDILGQVLEYIEKETGVRFPDDLTPWIGQYIGVGVVDLPGESGDRPEIVIALEARSQSGADRFLAKLENELEDRQDMQFNNINYRGARIKVMADSEGQVAYAFGRAGNMVLLATNEAAIKNAIKAQNGRSLADEKVFNRLLEKTTWNSLVKVYVPSESVKDWVDEAETKTNDIFMLRDYPFYHAWEGLLLSAGSSKTGLQVDILNLYNLGELSSKERKKLKTTAQDYPSVAYLPDSTLFYTSGMEFNQISQALLEIIAFSGERRKFPEILMGVDLNKDIWSKLDEDWVIAIAPSNASQPAEQGKSDFGLIGLFGTSDETEVTKAVKTICENIIFLGMGTMDESQKDGIGCEMSDIVSTRPIYLGVNRGFFVLSTGSDLLDGALNSSQHLVDSEAYQELSNVSSGGGKPILYVDVQGLIDEMRKGKTDTELESINAMVGILNGVQGIAAGQELLGDDIMRTRMLFFSPKDN